MKKAVLLILVMGAMFSGNNIYGSGKKGNPSGNPAKTMQVTFDNVSAGSRLYIKNSNDRILYSEKVQSKGVYSKGFDFSSLPVDDYYFEVEKNVTISINPFTVTADGVEFHKELNRDIVKPILFQDSDRVKLMRNLNGQQSIDVKIFFQGRELVFSETIEKDGMIGRVYDFSTSLSGDYLFSIDFAGRNYSKYMSINAMN